MKSSGQSTDPCGTPDSVTVICKAKQLIKLDKGFGNQVPLRLRMEMEVCRGSVTSPITQTESFDRHSFASLLLAFSRLVSFSTAFNEDCN